VVWDFRLSGCEGMGAQGTGFEGLRVQGLRFMCKGA